MNNIKEISFNKLQIGDIYKINVEMDNVNPIIKIISNTKSIKFKCNNLVITLTDLTTTPFYIDCLKYECYEEKDGRKIPAMFKFYSNEFYDFPELNEEIENTLTVLEGSIEQFIITYSIENM